MELKERKLVPIWIVWECREGVDQIRAIDTKEENARRHKLALKHESETFSRDNKIWIEQTVLDHLYGWEMLQMVLHGKGQRDYANEVLGSRKET